MCGQPENRQTKTVSRIGEMRTMGPACFSLIYLLTY